MTGGFQLQAKRAQPWRAGASLPTGVALEQVLYGPDPAGPGGLGFQVATATIHSGRSAPSLGDLRALYRLRAGTGTTPTVIAVTNGSVAWLIGPSTEQSRDPLPHELAQRYLQSVLQEPNTQSAYNRMISLSHASETTMIPGVTNSGLFASHHLRENAPHRPDWGEATAVAAAALTKRGAQLIQALSFKSEQATGGIQILSGVSGPPSAVAVVLDDTEHFEATSQRFQLSPVAFGLKVAMSREIPWLIVLRRDQIRIYPGRDGVGVGQKGQTETYFELDLAALDSDYAALLPLVFSAAAVQPDGSAHQLLDESARFASALGARLRDRIYVEVVPPLATAVAQHLSAQGHPLDGPGLNLAYRVTLRILFRLLFQAYAEDRGLLPSGRNERYDANSLKAAAQRDLDTDPSDFSADGSQLWMDLAQVWNAIDKGNKLWQVPAYNGGLFSGDPAISKEGAILATLTLPDAIIGPALQHLLVDESEDGTRGPVDFRSLSVREFGTIYEGLLESSLSVAEQDLTVDANGAWVPAKRGEPVEATAGSVYFHSASGERKATGSYFTPKFVVDHLIERSLAPALEAHLAQVTELLMNGDEVAAERLFFDFRVADLSMGSGHFLVAAIDKIEALMRNFLTEHSLLGIQSELLRLAEVAKNALGDDEVAKSEVDNVALLRRQIARRCIYGLDVNDMSVELARLAMWIHTFVPGLPMSNLDHGLVCANSLTGIGTVEEALEALQPGRRPGEQTFFDDVITDSLISAKTLLTDMADAGEADKQQVAEAAALLAQARQAAEPTRHIFDTAVATRIGRISAGSIMATADIDAHIASGLLDEIHEQLKPAHMPYLFPEVFLRDNPGFDVILGNPPYEELQVEEPKFWLRARPGLLGLNAAAQRAEVKRLRTDRADLLPELEREVAEVAAMRKVLLAGPYPGLGTGDIDLYQAFAWRFWQLLRTSGYLGVITARTLFNSAGGVEWRKATLSTTSAELIVLTNSARWVFKGAHPQYSFCMISVAKVDDGDGELRLAGPFHTLGKFIAGKSNLGAITFKTLEAASAGAAIPNLPDSESVAIFRKMRGARRLDTRRPGWDFRPVAEFHATNDRSTFDAGEGKGRIPVCPGRGFNIWEPETGEVYAWADPKTVEDALFTKRQNQVRRARSAFHGLPHQIVADRSTLPFHHPRIAFRDVARATDTRTCIAALIPPETICQNSAPYLLVRSGGPRETSFLLAVLSSIPLDWYARLYVELHLNLHIFNGLPIPEFDGGSPLCIRTVEVAGRLAAIDGRFADWAAEVGVPVGSVERQADKDDLIAELDALVSLLYGLTEHQVEHVFATFHRGWRYEPRLAAVLKHFTTWRTKA
ncbi:hypothetical protein AB0876_19300 [Mycobacterium sp. NPDC049093]